MKQGSTAVTRPMMAVPPSMRTQTPEMHTVSRGELRTLAMEFENDMRNALAELEISCAERPQPKTLVRDVVRGRPASETTFRAAELAVARDASPEALLRYCYRYFLALSRQSRHATTSCANTALDHETIAQADADIWQRRALEAIRTGDRVTLNRCLEACGSHLLRLIEFQSHLQTALTSCAARRAHFNRSVTA